MKVETPRGELHTDAIHVKLTSDSIIIPWYANFSDQRTMVGLCCGGYGGWTYGARFAANLGWPKFRHIGIDNDLLLRHNMPLTTQPCSWRTRQSQLEWMLKRYESITFFADILDMKFAQSLAMLGSEIWTFSFPCQCWSNSAYGRGFHDANGQILAKGLGQARIFRPKFLLLENVKNFPEHDQFPVFLKIVYWCGFRIVVLKVLDAADRLPSTRVRWLAILQRI